VVGRIAEYKAALWPDDLLSHQKLNAGPRAAI
jgi:hypothetical protein